MLVSKYYDWTYRQEYKTNAPCMMGIVPTNYSVGMGYLSNGYWDLSSRQAEWPCVELKRVMVVKKQGKLALL